MGEHQYDGRGGIVCTQAGTIAHIKTQAGTIAGCIKRIEATVYGNGTPGLRRELDAVLLNAESLKKSVESIDASVKSMQKTIRNVAYFVVGSIILGGGGTVAAFPHVRELLKMLLAI